MGVALFLSGGRSMGGGGIMAGEEEGGSKKSWDGGRPPYPPTTMGKPTWTYVAPGNPIILRNKRNSHPLQLSTKEYLYTYNKIKYNIIICIQHKYVVIKASFFSCFMKDSMLININFKDLAKTEIVSPCNFKILKFNIFFQGIAFGGSLHRRE